MTLDVYLSDNHKTRLVFDFDETLYHLKLPWGEFITRLEHRLKPMDEGIFAAFAQGDLGLGTMQNAYIKKYGNTAREIIIREMLEFEKHLTGAPANPELTAWVKEHSKDFRMSIWSSNSSEIIRRVLSENGLHDVFAPIISRLEVDMLKPVPEGFEKIHEHHVPKSAYLMIGNSRADLEAAQNAGIDFYHEKYFTPDMFAD